MVKKQKFAVGTTVNIKHCSEGDAYSNTNAVIREQRKDGTLLAELFIYNSFSGVEQEVVLRPEDSFQSVSLEEFEVTVCRCGSVRIPAINREQAISLVDRFATQEDVLWDEDWPADDATPIQEETGGAAYAKLYEMP